jgi:selenocysteine lyase/cysteine desulfurase
MRLGGLHPEEPATEPHSNIRIVTVPAVDAVQLVPTRPTDLDWLVVDGTAASRVKRAAAPRLYG